MTSTNDTGLTNAVRINCCASKPVFESVTLANGDVERRCIARRIGIPLCAAIDYQDNAQPSEIGIGWSHALTLHTYCELDLEEESEVWGSNNYSWSHCMVGDVYMIREDSKPLCPKLLEALCAWYWYELRPQFKEAKEEFERARKEFEAANEEFETEVTELIDNREHVLALISKENFEAFREIWDRERDIAVSVDSIREKLDLFHTSTDEVEDIKMEMD
ncbi:hypothetical protein KCU65_g8075, partial [Aureobasidium melanogenum]